MGISENLIDVRMRLKGARQVQAESKATAKSIEGVGAAAGAAGAESAAAGAGGISKFQKSMKNLKGFGTKMKSVGSSMTTGLTVPLALVGGLAIKSSLDFSDAMELIHTQAGASQKEVAKMTNAVMEFSKSGKSIEGPNDLAKGLFRIESAGFRGKRAIEAMHSAEELAMVGHSDFEKTTVALVAAMNTGIKGTKNLKETIGILNATVGAGNMRFEDLVSAMGTGVLPSAAQVGLSLKDVGAALATMTSQGLPARRAATGLRMALSMMAAPTDKAAEALNDMGLGTVQLAKVMQKRGLLPALSLLKSKLDGMSKVEQTQALSAMFGGGKTSAGITLLLRSLGDLETRYDHINKGAASFNEKLKHTEAQNAIKLKQVWAKLQDVFIELGQTLVPIVVPALEMLADGIEAISGVFESLPASARKWLGILLLVVAVAGPILVFMGSMVIAVAALSAAFVELDISMGGLPLIMGAVTAVAVGLSGIFSSSSSAGDRLAQTTDNVTKYMDAQRTAGNNLVSSEHRVTQAKHRHTRAAHEFFSAQSRVNNVIALYGPGSKPAIHAEQMLAQKRWNLVRATKALKNIQRQHGIELQMTKQLSRSAVLEARHEINQLKAKKEGFVHLFVQESNNHASSQRLNEIAEWSGHVTGRLGEAHKDLNTVLLEAAKKVGPKYAKFLQNANRETLELGGGLEVVNSELEGLIELSGKLKHKPLHAPKPITPLEPGAKGGGHSPGGGGHSGSGTGGGSHLPSGSARVNYGLFTPPPARPHVRPRSPRAAGGAVELILKGGSKEIHLHNEIVLDGKKVARSTTKHVLDAEARS